MEMVGKNFGYMGLNVTFSSFSVLVNWSDTDTDRITKRVRPAIYKHNEKQYLYI